MNRKIKFRMKDKQGEWQYVEMVCSIIEALKDPVTPGGIDIDENTIGQYTGIDDKNGKEIYEGDIIQYEDITKGLVRYSEKYAQYVLVDTGSVKDEFEPLGDYNMEVFEIIGNEFDNPDLLEKGAEE